MIPKDILLEYGAKIKPFKKSEFLFLKGDNARYYYQIVSGKIKMNNFSDNGREFTQGIFTKGDSFGEPPLFIEKKYPANAQVIEDAEVLMLLKNSFLQLLNEQKMNINVIKILAERLYYKAVIAVEMSTETAGHRIISLLNYFKNYINKDKKTNKELYKIELTRQEIANLTGLRVETVIRAIKNLEKDGNIKIIGKKIYI